jgi:hypothetical protein
MNAILEAIVLALKAIVEAVKRVPGKDRKREIDKRIDEEVAKKPSKK